MNIRFENQSIRFRVNEDEFKLLLNQETLHNTLFLPEGQKLVYSIHAVDRRAQSMLLIVREHNWKLEIAINALQELKDKLPCKDGLVYKQYNNAGSELDDLEINFDVDIKHVRK